jgi:hypothetical protein
MTADGWSVDTMKASFLGVTAHWVDVKDGKWKLWAEVVGFRGISGEHSGANLGRYFLGVCERVGIVNAQRSKVNTFQCDILITLFTWSPVNSSTLSHLITHQTTQQHVRQLRHFTADENFDGTARKINFCKPFNSAVMVLINILFIHRCLAHVVNLGNFDVMAHITKIAAVETTTAIWKYDPLLLDNRMLNGLLDVIAAIQTLAIKECLNFELCILIPIFSFNRFRP